MLSEALQMQQGHKRRNMAPLPGRSPSMRLRPVQRLARAATASYCQLRDFTEFSPSLRIARPYTMLWNRRLFSLARSVRTVIREGVPGDFVECGVWRGGASFLMADLLRRYQISDRRVWLFDSFRGLPAPTDLDGPAAADYVQAVDSPKYLDNCSASIEEVEAAAERLGLAPRIRTIKGWFDETLPQFRNNVGPIALLRVDADWHDSVLCCLESLYDQVSPGGFVIFDDYNDWDGCAIAVHEFLGARHLSHRLVNASDAWFRKC